MKTLKRPAAMIAASVVALAMVSPTAALATDGDRGKDRGHEASERRDHDGERDRGGKAKASNEARADDKAENKHKARAGHEAEHGKQAKQDERTQSERVRSDEAEGDRKAKQDREAKDDQRARADAAKADRPDADQDASEKGSVRSDEAKATRTTSKTRAGTSKADDRDERRAGADGRGTDGGPWNVKAPVCHATSSATNPYVMITVSHKSIVKGAGHGGHDGDIIPPFTYRPSRDAEPVEFPGQNWDAEGQALFEDGCMVDGAVAPDAGDDVEDDDTDRDDVGGDGTETDRDRGRWNVKAPLCHATSSATNPYVMITVSHKSIVKDAGHGAHADDIIPPFAYQPHRDAESAVYPGLNWDDEGRELFANGCVLPTGDEVAGEGDDSDDNGETGDTGGTESPGATERTPTVESPTTDVDGDATIEDEVLGVVLDDSEESTDDEVLGVADEVDDDTAATEGDVAADTEVQAAQSSDEESSAGVLAMTGASLLVLLIAGLASLFAGAGLLRRRS